MQKLDLSFNNVGGTIPDLSNLTDLSSIDLSGNQIGGTISPFFANLSSLEQLHFYGNSFEGTLPVELLQLTKLTHIIIAQNQFTGELPSLSLLPRLQYLDISDNSFEGSAEFMNSTNIDFVNASHNLFNSFPSLGGSSHDLKTLIINHNLLTYIPDAIGDMSLFQLTTLVVWNNDFSQTRIPDLQYITSLTYFDCSDCGIDRLFPFLKDMSQLIFFDFHDNLLSEKGIPGSLSDLTNLEYLDLSRTGVTGDIPGFFGNFVKLEYLLLAGNSLEGEVPLNFCDMTDLRYLDMSDNTNLGCFYQCL
jgi:Leucine-rich repeat (LRR) protein